MVRRMIDGLDCLPPFFPCAIEPLGGGRFSLPFLILPARVDRYSPWRDPALGSGEISPANEAFSLAVVLCAGKLRAMRRRFPFALGVDDVDVRSGPCLSC